MIQQQTEAMEKIKKVIMLRILDKGARERLSNLKIIKPDLAAQLEMYLVQMYQTGQLRGAVTEEQLRKILSMMVQRKDFRITRK